MAHTNVGRTRILRTARLTITLAVLAVPRLCLAQDDRTDDPPERSQPLQPSGLVGASGGSGSGGGTPGPVGTTGQAGTTTATPITGLFTEPKILTKGINFAIDKFDTDHQRNKDGWYAEFSNLITGAGWISVGPGYRRWVWNDKAFYDASAAVSWHLYQMAQTRFEAPDLTKRHITLGAQVMWQDQTQINYFGTGPNTLEAERSQYRLRSTDVVVYAAMKPSIWTLSGEVGYLINPKLSSPSGTFKPDVPTTQELFPDVPGTQITDQPSYVHSQAAIAADTRNYRGRPTRGFLYRIAADDYVAQDTAPFSFRQYQAEALQFVRVNGPSWVLAFHGWAVTTDVPSSNQVPFYFLPSLGGATSLRSFQSYRFHDLNSLLVDAESRWAMWQHVDVALFVDAGNVAPTFRTLNIDHTSVGGGLRLHTDKTTWARLDVAHGSEGWQAFFRTSDFFRLARITRRVADIPFVP